MKIKKIIPFALLALAAVFFTSCLTISVSNSNSNVEEQAKSYKFIPYIAVTLDYGDKNLQPAIQKRIDDAVASTCLTVVENLENLTEEQKKQAFDVDFRFDYSDVSMKVVVKLYLYDYLTGRKLAEFEVSRYANFEESLNQCLDEIPGTFTESFAK